MTTKAQLAEQLLAASIHEIKNRFGLVFSQLDTLLSSLPLDAGHQHNAEQIKSEAQFIGSELVRVLASYNALMSDDSDVNDASLVQNQQFLVDFLEEKIARHSNTVCAHSLQLEYQCDEDLDGYFDPALISIILDTAIYNAVKENAKTILLVAEKSDTDSLIIRIEDDGPGFPQAMTQTTNEDTADTNNLNKTGALRHDGHSTGLGLYFAHTLIAQHQEGGYSGRIELGASERLGGACVTLILPQ